MLRLKVDSSKLSQNGSVPNNLFSDISTRSLNSVTVGENAGKISRGSGNAFLGFECGNQNIDGSFGVFMGYQAGQYNTNGNWNTFLGCYTGRQNAGGNKNTFVGFRAGELGLDASECVAIGANAMRENSVGNRNVAVGISAGERMIEGDNNTMIGAESGQNIRSGNLNTMAGYRSGKGSYKGNENTYFGAYSGYSNEVGDGNAFIGYRSGEYIMNGSYNVAVGAHTLQYMRDGTCNIAIGAFSGSKLSGTGNVIVGTGAAGNITNGNYNTNIGTNSGNNASGDNNVYIGYKVSANTFGEKNVVIGSSAFSSNNSSNSVIIGYSTANTVFKNGGNNIFIGVGADAHTSETSFAIAIGSKNTRSGEKAISIGENIANGGQNSLLLGYDMYSDSDQCISIGYKAQINNVIVFNDTLNYIFPVNTITEYETFNLQEDYSDMLGVSNITAVASIFNANVYDSGCNLLQGLVRAESINLLEKFNSNVISQNITILHNSSNTTIPQVFGISQLPDHKFKINNNLTSCNLKITIPNGVDGSNLIPINPSITKTINYEYVIGRRLSIDTFALTNSYNITDNKLTENIFVTNLELNQIVLQSFETSNFFDKSQNRTVITQHPRYGDITITNNKLSYTMYPEALFVYSDTFSVAIATKMGTYTVLSEDIPLTTIQFMNKTYPVNTNINFHKDRETVLDFTYSNSINIANIDPNLIFLQPSNLIISNINMPVSAPLRLTDGRVFSCTYIPKVQNALSYCNIEIISETFSFNSNIIPIGKGDIIEYPKYGHLDILSNTYIPDTFNFTKDTFKIASNDTLYTLDVLTQTGAFKTEILNTVINPLHFTSNSNNFSPYEHIREPDREILIYVLNKRTTNGILVSVNDFNVVQTTPCDPRGYIHTSNLIINEGIRSTTYEAYVTFNPSVVNESVPYDYFAYDRGANNANNPYISINEYTWDYNLNGFGPSGKPIILGTNNEPQFYSNINNESEHRYFIIDFRTKLTEILYKEASNITIYNSNLFYNNDSYVDNYNNYIYTTRTEFSNESIISSNVELVLSPSLPIREEIRVVGFSNDVYRTINISTLQLQDTNFYEYNGVYNVSPSNNTIVLQKHIGPVTTFHQSNITNKEIHIWGESNLILTDREIVINYYSNIEKSSNVVVLPEINTRKQPYIFNDTILHTSNISFLNNNVCLGDGDSIITYLNSSNNLVTQRITSKYLVLNPIQLNIGLKNVATKLRRTDLFFKFNSQEINYTINNDESVQFYRNNVATSKFTQNDINDGLITIEGTGYIGEVTFKLEINTENYTSTQQFIINTYIQNAYLNSVTSNTTSNIISQSNNVYLHSFNGPIWEDLDNRRDDVTIHILNNPVNGFLYSSTTKSVVNTIGYTDFKTQKIHYIPYEPMSDLQDTFDVFFSYLNVASPIYSIDIQNVFIPDKTIENITRCVSFINTTINIDVDQSSYTYFDRLMDDFIGKEVIFYILKVPQHGVILNKQFLSVAYFTSDDILNNKVFYQNYKGTTTDSFEIKVGTNRYDLSLNTATVVLTLLPFPTLLKNTYGYIYSDSITSGTYYPLDSSKLDISSGGIYVSEKEYMDVFVKNKTTNMYMKSDSFLKEDDVYYRPSSDFFKFNSNENKTMKMKFFTYSNINIREPTPISTFDIYTDIYVFEWYSKYNTFESVNTIVKDINPNQSISYTLNSNMNLFKNKKCKIQFDYKPFQSVIDNENTNYNEFLKTYKYSFKLIDFSDNVLLEINFENTSNVVKAGENEIKISSNAAKFGNWNRFYFINYDDTNNEKLSIYIEDVNYTHYMTIPVPIDSIDLSDLKEIRINVPITDQKNNYTSPIIREINNNGTKLYYNLQNYNTIIEFKNFQILLGIYDLQTQKLEPSLIYGSTYNIAIGDYLRVNGFNNICIGKNFLTTGKGSIIIGNDIGSSPNSTSMSSLSFNEIFNCIIISTSSFIETKVRDVIAIGTNIFNNAGGLADIDLFFSKKPVLIGNNITVEMIDFHVNIQNSFLITEVGYKQVYCGLGNEAVCIGYTSNAWCNNDVSKLYVNGNVNVEGTIIEKSTDTYRMRYMYPDRKISTFSPHVYRMEIVWENSSTDIHDILTLECKFKFIGNFTNFGYYNFESVIATSINAELYSITKSVRGNVTHVIEPFDRGVAITLRWVSDFTDYLLANMEVECVALNILGNLVFA